jgi:calcium-dependent protein kinase
MFENKSSTAEIKVIDFGLSKKFATSRLGIMREGVGTLYSMAPQVLQGVYNSQADMWSVGVITFMLLSSHRPFYNKKRKIMIDRIMRCDYTFKKDYWKPISDDAKDFIDHLLVLDPKVRYDASKAQKHKWLHKQFKMEDRAPTESVTGRVADNLLMYSNNLSLKKLALNVIAHRSSTAEIINLRKAFDQFDSGNDGVISSEEFKVAIQDKCSYSNDEIKELFNSIDINNNGQIMYTEFIAATLEAQGQLDEARIAEAFDRLDTDDTGFISKENIMEFLSDTDATMEDIEHMIQAADTDHCGQGMLYYIMLALFFFSSSQFAPRASTNIINILLLRGCLHFYTFLLLLLYFDHQQSHSMNS